MDVTVNSLEQKSQEFCPNYAQENTLCLRRYSIARTVVRDTYWPLGLCVHMCVGQLTEAGEWEGYRIGRECNCVHLIVSLLKPATPTISMHVFDFLVRPFLS